jgi:hypothetical protein
VVVRERVVPPPGEAVVVQEAPPSPQVEVVGVAPSPLHVWIGGFWAWHGRWVWEPGRWELRPRGRVAWVAGHWDRHLNGWVWVPGHWE